MQLEGQDVVRYLTGQNTVRDGLLTRMTVTYADGDEPIIHLEFAMRPDWAVRTVRLELRDVEGFDLSYQQDNPPREIAFVKCLWTADGQFYLSLDPYDEREDFISEQDNDFFTAKFVRMIAE